MRPGCFERYLTLLICVFVYLVILRTIFSTQIFVILICKFFHFLCLPTQKIYCLGSQTFSTAKSKVKGRRINEKKMAFLTLTKTYNHCRKGNGISLHYQSPKHMSLYISEMNIFSLGESTSS